MTSLEQNVGNVDYQWHGSWRAFAWLALLSSMVTSVFADGLIGAGPYYAFDKVAGLGTEVSPGAAINNDGASPIFEAIPPNFMMNDGGDVLANYRVKSDRPEKGDYFQGRNAYSAYDQFTLIRSKSLTTVRAS